MPRGGTDPCRLPGDESTPLAWSGHRARRSPRARDREQGRAPQDSTPPPEDGTGSPPGRTRTPHHPPPGQKRSPPRGRPHRQGDTPPALSRRLRDRLLAALTRPSLHPGPPDPTPALRVSPDGVMVRMGAGTPEDQRPEDQRPEDQRMGDGTASGPDTVAGRDAACGGVAPEGMTEGDATGAILRRRTCARPGPGEPPDGDPPDGVRPAGPASGDGSAPA